LTGLDPVIHVFRTHDYDVDPRVKPAGRELLTARNLIGWQKFDATRDCETVTIFTVSQFHST